MLDFHGINQDVKLSSNSCPAYEVLVEFIAAKYSAELDDKYFEYKAVALHLYSPVNWFQLRSTLSRALRFASSDGMGPAAG